MDMNVMLGVLASVYFVSLTLICLYRKKINTKIFNIVFIVADVIFYFVWNLGMQERGWLKNGFQTLGNISPFTFTLIPFTLIMKDKLKEYAYAAIAFLWVGMFLALFISPEYTYLFDYKTEANLAYTGEALCHMLAALFGVYLILTEQVKLNLATWMKSIVFLYSVILYGVFLNYFFHKDNFGMDMYGNYSIYMFDLFGSFETTFIAYLLGVLVVLTIGMQAGMVMERLTRPREALPLKKSVLEEVTQRAETL